MNIPKFVIIYNNGDEWYGGGEDDELVPVYFSRKWLEAPSDGVSHIVVENPSLGRSVRKEYEFYYQMPLNFHGEGDIGGSMKIGAYLRQAVDDGGFVKFGGWTSTATYQENARKAHTNDYIKKESAKHREQQEDSTDD